MALLLWLFFTVGILAVFVEESKLPDYLVQQHRPVIFNRIQIIEGVIFSPWADLMSNNDWFISTQGCINCNVTGHTNITDSRFVVSDKNFSVTYGAFGEMASGQVSGRIWKLTPTEGGPFEIPIVDEISSETATWNPAGQPSTARIGLNSDFSDRMKLKSVYLTYDYICTSKFVLLDENTGCRTFVSGDMFPMLDGHQINQVHSISDVTPNKENYWQFQVHYVVYRGFNIYNHYPAFEAILSTTSPYIHAPSEFIDFVSKFMQPVRESTSGDYIVDCNQRVLGGDIVFFVNGGKISLKSLYYTMRDTTDPSICALRIRPLPKGEDPWILGIPFVEAVDICLGIKSKTIVFGNRNHD